MLTALKVGYFMLICAAPQRPPLSADFRTEFLRFFFLTHSFLYTLQPPASHHFHLRVRGRLEGRIPASSYDFDG